VKRRELKGGRHIVVLCKGRTEEIAVKHFISRQWEADGLKAVGLLPINLKGKLKDIFEYVPLYHRDPKFIAVFTLIDLCGMSRVQHNRDDELFEKVARVKNWLQDDFEPIFFRPHLSVHEIEAWLLAEGDCLAKRLKDTNIKPDRNAETKNFDNPPHRRIEALFKSRHHDDYHKINDGTLLFQCLQFQPVYDTCQYFREFYNELKSVGRSAVNA